VCYKLLKTEHLSPKRRRKTKKNFAGNLCPLLPRDTAKKRREEEEGYGWKDLRKRKVSSLEWKSEG